MTRDLEHIMLKRANSLFLKNLREAELRNEALQKSGESLEAAFERDNEGPPFKLIVGRIPAPAAHLSMSSPSIAPQQRNAMRPMTQEEAKCIYAEETGPSMQKGTEEALSDIFFTGFEEAKSGFNTASYFFIEGVLTEMSS